MQNSDSRRTLALGLIGGLLGALLITSMPAVTAAVGDPIRVGRINRGFATTVLRSPADQTLRVVNTGGGEALNLRVGQGNRPLTVDSNTRIPKLNADRVDNRHANQLVRAAYALEPETITDNGAAASVEITAPTAGLLVLSGSAEVYLHSSAGSRDRVQCSLFVQRGSTTIKRGYHNVTVHEPGTPHTSNDSAICASDAAFGVQPGTYEVGLWFDQIENARISGSAVWAIFVPFDGEGNPPDDLFFFGT